jgi:flagellar motor switch protein FliN
MEIDAMSEQQTMRVEKDTEIFFSQFLEATASVLAKITGKTFSIRLQEAQPEQGLSGEETDLILLGAADGGLRGEFLVQLQREAVQVFGQTLLGEVPDTSVALKTDFREAAEELMRQITGVLGTGLATVFGDVHLRLVNEPLPTWPSVARASLVITAEGFPETNLMLSLSSALAASLRKQSPMASPAVRVQGERDFDPFMNVQLAVTLRFGARKMVLREILELNAGAVVELDRKVQAPVDLLLDGRVIGRGEVVVVDGNYGLRVTELDSGAAEASHK